MNRTLYWAPRVLCILFIGFVSLFALDVFDGKHGFWQTVLDLSMHLIPSLVLLAALLIAWRREWFGTAVFAFAAIFFAGFVRADWWGKAMFVVPCLITAFLFLLNWRMSRRETLH